jgi:hypothetical protein
MIGLTEVGTHDAGFDPLRRTAASMMSQLAEAARMLEELITEELDRSPVKDRQDRAYPLSARSMEDRLANIRATIASLQRVT